MAASTRSNEVTGRPPDRLPGGCMLLHELQEINCDLRKVQNMELKI
jgi:hypothetical protein